MATMDWRPDRRRSTRVDLLADLQGHVITLDEAVVVRQISDGGLTIETTAPLSPHLAHDFRLTVDGRSAIVHARVRHSRVKVAGDAVAYLSGLEFVDLSEDGRALVAAILDRAGGAPQPGDTI
jgi:hypothetical protein